MRGGSSRERVGSDVAAVDDALRFLDRPIPANSDARQMVSDLIAGIDSIRRVRAWIGAERRRAEARGTEPRDVVIDALERRESVLERIGERPDRLAFGPRRPCECCGPGDGLSAQDIRERRQADREQIGGYAPSTSTNAASGASGPSSEATSLDAFGADQVAMTDGAGSDADQGGDQA